MPAQIIKFRPRQTTAYHLAPAYAHPFGLFWLGAVSLSLAVWAGVALLAMNKLT
jgi:hypothetical protein